MDFLSQSYLPFSWRQRAESMGKKKIQSQRPNVPVTEKYVKQKVDKG